MRLYQMAGLEAIYAQLLALKERDDVSDMGNHNTQFKFAYAIFDKTAEEYGEPFFATNRATAIRNFKSALSKLPDVLSMDEFRLDLVGLYYNEVFIPLEKETVMLGSELKPSMEVP